MKKLPKEKKKLNTAVYNKIIFLNNLNYTLLQLLIFLGDFFFVLN